MKSELKHRVHEEACIHLETRLTELMSEKSSLEKDLTSESKSSAGDKHETGRAMIHQEIEKVSNQILQSQRMLNDLQALGSSASNDTVQHGSLFMAEGKWIYVSVALGTIRVDDTPVFLISPQAPLFRVVMGLSVGAEYAFNHQTGKIETLI